MIFEWTEDRKNKFLHPHRGKDNEVSQIQETAVWEERRLVGWQERGEHTTLKAKGLSEVGAGLLCYVQPASSPLPAEPPRI